MISLAAYFITHLLIGLVITVIAVIIAFWGIRHLPEGS